MTVGEQVFSRAVVLAGDVADQQGELLKVLCGTSAASLQARLREGISPGDCREDFLTAASLLALAALREAEGKPAEFKAGDLTVKGGGDAASRCLREQAMALMGPYLQDSFAFRGV